ncbi:hypothetical protein HIM_03067 [Hirsutella minnesotensis 3608]|nr:hypothetical protein HIM_03067 [Hirsutella minnesotensis 3608]
MSQNTWKSTLHLPTGAFPIRPILRARRPLRLQCTDELYPWQAKDQSRREEFILHDGPPYANGPLHIGHAVNKILKDIILRLQLQKERRVVYRPSWDCHGLPIELKALEKIENDDTRPVTIREVSAKLAAEAIKEQQSTFRSFAVMADWKNKWTTMDKEYEIEQLKVFQKMVRHGLIYRKHKPVYWSPSSRTALAEAELEYQDKHVSKAAFVKFPIISGWKSLPGLGNFNERLYAAIWTTTPWTLPANKAIGVHRDLQYSVLRIKDFGLLVASSRADALKEYLPEFEVVTDAIPGSALIGLEYFNKLRGKSSRGQPIVHADFVSADSGTGLVHMAPGHGQEDYEVCSSLGIEAFAPIDDEGFFTSEAYPDQPELLTYAPPVLKGGAKAVLGLMGDDVLNTHNFRHRYPYDWRSKEPVVVRATAQWFADVASIKPAALKALDHVEFVPVSGKARLKSFIEARNEWCISRQRSWGVPIPVLYDAADNAVMTDESIEHIISVMKERGTDAWYSDDVDDPAWLAPSLKGTYYRGADTMDVWFDSGTSWTQTDAQADVYLEGSDQHRGWFQSSLLTYVAVQKAAGKADHEVVAPFKTLITHGFALDAQGKKMSKSVGNTVLPQDVMDGTLLNPSHPDQLGADALRLWVASTDFTSDLLIGRTILETVHQSLKKYRTILRMLTGLLRVENRATPLTKLDQVALMQMRNVMAQVREEYDNYEFHKAVGLINNWVSNDLSAFFIEASKDRLYCGEGSGVLEPIFNGFLRMLAPITPMLVEEAWASRPHWMHENNHLVHPSKQRWDAPLIASSRMTVSKHKLRKDMELIEPVRHALKGALEQARAARALGSSLQCDVIITTDRKHQLGPKYAYWLDELATMFVVSRVGVDEPLPPNPAWCYSKDFGFRGQVEGTVHVLPPEKHKCPRCWRYVVEVQNSLCNRCEEVISNMPPPR